MSDNGKQEVKVTFFSDQTRKRLWYVAFFGAIIAFAVLVITSCGATARADCQSAASLPPETQQWLGEKTPEGQQWLLCNLPASQMGPFTAEDAFPEGSPQSDYLPPVDSVFQFSDEAYAAKHGGYCRHGTITDRVRSWPTRWTIVSYKATLRFCHKHGTVQTHHFHAGYGCCSTWWSVYDTKRITRWKRWHGRPHGAFMGVYQVRAHFCPPVVGCSDDERITGRVIGQGNGRVHRNTDAGAI